MNKLNILTLLCGILGIGYINAGRIADPLPVGFMDDHDSFILEPVQKTTLENIQIIFKFGSEKNHGNRVWAYTKNDYSPTPRDVHISGGYPSVYGGKVKKLSYAEITIATDNNSADAKFFHYRTKYDDASFFKFVMNGTNTKRFYYSIEIFE